jgi:hypothetical protein
MGLGVKAMKNVRGRWEVGLGKRRRWRHKDVVALRVVVVVVAVVVAVIVVVRGRWR